MQLRTEIEIAAPAATVWDVLTDFAAYHEWNPFITTLSGPLQVGERLTVVVSPPEISEFRLRPRVLVCDENRELRWLGSWGAEFLFRGEHFFRLVETDSGTRFVHGEDFEGMLVKLMSKQLTHTARGFVFMNQALKRRVESQHQKSA